jgi:ABC-type dipeptide/oligopeptide/nickel transport system permease subunit
MTTIRHEAVQRRRPDLFLARDVSASLAISTMWLAVLLDALFGPDILATSNDGNATKIPSAIVVALFAWLATAAVARYAFSRREPS